MYIIDDSVVLGDVDGFLFEGDQPDSYCFVPASCVVRNACGYPEVDLIAYVRSAWHERNASFNVSTSGSALFPRCDRWVEDWRQSLGRAYVDRLTALYACRDGDGR